MQVSSLSNVVKGLRALPHPQFCSVISTSTDIYTNLSLEEALREGVPFRDVVNGTPSSSDMSEAQRGYVSTLQQKYESATSAISKRHFTEQMASLESPMMGLLFSYINTPCVVIGRNQNPWKEASMGGLTDTTTTTNPVRLARRNSGGGTVFHDTGNVCFSFMSHRSVYDPARSIELVRAYLLNRFPMIQPNDLTTTKRNDLFLQGKKITGSAMKITAKGCYHHCTLLVSSDRGSLGKYLRPSHSWDRVVTTSVDSVRSPVTTLATELGLETIQTQVGCGENAPANVFEGDGDVCLVAAALQRDFAEFYMTSDIPREVLLGAGQVDTVPNVWKEGRQVKAATAGYLKSLPSPVVKEVVRWVSSSIGEEDVRSKRDDYTSVSWQLLDNTPKFTTYITIDLLSLMAGSEILELIEGCPPFQIVTTVEKGAIKEIAVQRIIKQETTTTTDADTTTTTPVVNNAIANSSWMGVVLTTLFEGTQIRNPANTAHGGVAAPVSFTEMLQDMEGMVLAAIKTERAGSAFYIGSGMPRKSQIVEQTQQADAMDFKEIIPAIVSTDECWFLLQAVVRSWEEKNAW